MWIVFEISGVKEAVMTNDPFDDNERKVWFESYKADPLFRSSPPY